jgi:hypothetical protein
MILPILFIAAQLFSATPINDLGQQTYLSFQGGLYENNSNTIPMDYDLDGQTFATLMQPLDGNGNPSPTGKIVFTSIGMSNTQIEWQTFINNAGHNPAVNHTTLALGNGAASGMVACMWFPANGSPACSPTTPNQYDRVNAQMATRGLSPNQVQALWLKEANGRLHPSNRGCLPTGTLCLPLCDSTIENCSNTYDKTDAVNTEWELGNILRAAKTRWPNLKLVFLASRIYGGYTTNSLDGSPEPFAYETGFAVKWLVQAQVDQIRGAACDPVAGCLSYVDSPWTAWGPYIWANGPVPRSDSLVWCNGQLSTPCNGEVDFGSDGLHPNQTGINKVSNILYNFFSTSPYTASWFLKP